MNEDLCHATGTVLLAMLPVYVASLGALLLYLRRYQPQVYVSMGEPKFFGWHGRSWLKVYRYLWTRRFRELRDARLSALCYLAGFCSVVMYIGVPVYMLMAIVGPGCS